jgi:hypothetical protein
MALYRTSFERINFGISPPLKQSADVLFSTDIPFEDEHLEAFTEVMWSAMWEQNPHWANPQGPAGATTGWSSVLWNHKIDQVDEVANLAIAWHIDHRAWLMADETTPTNDPDEAGRFNLKQMAALQDRYPGERYSKIMPKKVSELYDPEGKPLCHNCKLQIRRDEYVFWGYGPRKDHYNMGLAVKRINFAGFTMEEAFELPKSYGGDEPQEYERKVCWAWRLHSEERWKFAESPEDADKAAREESIKKMGSSGWHEADAFFATKYCREVIDATDPSVDARGGLDDFIGS